MSTKTGFTGFAIVENDGKQAFCRKIMEHAEKEH
jgi:hypothetical protein